MSSRLSGREFNTSADIMRGPLGSYLAQMIGGNFQGLPRFNYDASLIRPNETQRNLAAAGGDLAASGMQDFSRYAMPTLRNLAETGAPLNLSPVFGASRDLLQRGIAEGGANLAERFGAYGQGSSAALANSAFQKNMLSGYNQDVLRTLAGEHGATQGRRLAAAQAIPQATGQQLDVMRGAQGMQRELTDQEYRNILLEFQNFMRSNPDMSQIVQLIALMNQVPGFVGGQLPGWGDTFANILGAAGGLAGGLAGFFPPTASDRRR